MILKDYLDNLWKYQRIKDTDKPATWSWADRLFLYREPKSTDPPATT